ncbi:MAG: TIR domain-containing protein [Tissierella sp.]|nr:TIR domain-containing protein [Tissierella sp.]
MGKKIFISYRADSEGSTYKNLLIAWTRNDNGYFDLNYNDTSVGTSINSVDSNYIKTVIKEKITSSEVFLCLIGKNTSTSDWVKWEIDKAIELNKKIVAVKINNAYTSPSNILGANAAWAKSFTYDSIKKAIDG